jgi:ankyrin repeat protein
MAFQGERSGMHGKRALIIISFLLLLFYPCLCIQGCGLQRELKDDIASGNLAGLKMLIDRNPGLIAANCDNRGGNPLFLATSLGKKEVVEYLITRKTNVNGLNVDGCRPLHSAARNDRVDIAGILIEKGAAVNITDNSGRTPLHYAVEKDCRGMVELLLSKGADPEAIDRQGRSPLFSSRSIIIASILMTAGAQPDARDYEGRSPSHYAAEQGFPDAARFLAFHEHIKKQGLHGR